MKNLKINKTKIKTLALSELILVSNKNILSIESSEFSKPTKRSSMGYSLINLYHYIKACLI